MDDVKRDEGGVLSHRKENRERFARLVREKGSEFRSFIRHIAWLESELATILEILDNGDKDECNNMKNEARFFLLRYLMEEK